MKPHLSGLFSGLVKGYLPQAWTFTTEEGTATLRVDKQGNASVADGVVAPLDVSVSLNQAQLEWALIDQGRGPRPAGQEPSIEFYSDKGQTAFQFLRSRFKL